MDFGPIFFESESRKDDFVYLALRREELCAMLVQPIAQGNYVLLQLVVIT